MSVNKYRQSLKKIKEFWKLNYNQQLLVQNVAFKKKKQCLLVLVIFFTNAKIAK